MTVARASTGLVDETWDADEALTLLYAAHWRGMVRLAWLLLHDQGRAEEVVQDAFVSMHRHWRRLGDAERALGYLRTSVVNGSRSALRHRAVENRWVLAGAPTATMASTTDRAHTELPSAEDAVVDSSERERVLQLVRALPSRQREVLVLRYYADLSEAEIAELLGISRGAVKSHAHRGLAALRRVVPPSDSDSGRRP